MDSSLAAKQPNLPCIEFSKENTEQGTDSWLTTSKKVVCALEDYGCFLATYNDNFSLDLHNAIFKSTRQLFDLPLETKLLNTSKTPSHGYVGQEPVVPLYEGLGIEDVTSPLGAQTFTNLMWPSGNAVFCETTCLFTKVVAELDQVVMRMVSQSYGIENHYERLLESTSYLFRLIKYRERHEKETVLGIVPHTDKSFMSILHQHQVPGLEIKTANDQWILVDPSPSSFIVMAGDACMAWTNGRIEAPQHRVIMKGTEERYSLGVFTFIRDQIIHIPEELADEEHEIQFQPFDHYKYIDFYYTDEGKKSKCPIKLYCGI
ncbi:putative 2-oxoglutarate-dependent dioxygenase AOP1 [Apium graveolens]|uniref:putative 2-oxoglutarate-dependent dioxygenase AOP1 n=1 Tax=Apium graveolens TaxID=4045 RepID=UPI003D78B58F